MFNHTANLGGIIMFEKLRKHRDDEAGASAVEYGLLVAAIAAIIVIIVFALGNVLQGSFKSTCDAISTTDDASCQTTGG